MSPRLLRAVGWCSAVVLGLLTMAVFVLVLIPAKDGVLPRRINYGLVFDAGSTHTSLYIYQWRADKENGTGIVSQVEACSVSGPGISSYADDPAGAGASLRPCLDRAMKIVPAEQQRDTATYLGATAGMRLLREENSTKAEQVLAAVSKAIGEYPVDFRGARILTGSEEGSFGWITVNYLLETLVKVQLGERHSPCTAAPGQNQGPVLWEPGMLRELTGGMHPVLLGRRSCSLGWAVGRVSVALHSSAQISHPCYPRGYQENLTVAELYDSPCVRAPSSASPGLVLTVTGTGDPATCGTAVQRLFNFSCGAQWPCGFNGVYQPPVRGQFFAFSGFYYTLHLLNLTEGQSLSLVNASIRQICNSSWKQVQELFPRASRTQLRDACTASSYILTLLLQGYKFNYTTWPNIYFVQQVANTDVGWTLGYMLNLTNMIPSEPPAAVTQLPRSIWIAATVLLAIMLIHTFCLLTATCCQRNSWGYEQL
uniref:Ectonucleoside triphosphate diphosphohydrolase 8 n=1 Tax=Cyanoderma ruficeps TaxID=181631 RepID=A0A8C3XDP5_9PASS